MKIIKLLILSGFLAGILSSCEKDNPVADLGTNSGAYRAGLTVAFSGATLEPEDTLTVTATTSHRNDKISKVEFLHTLYEKFGVIMELNNGTRVVTWTESDPNMVVTDTVINNGVWNSVSSENNELNNYYQTETGKYVIRAQYDLFNSEGSKYPNEVGLLTLLPEEAFAILKNQLAYAVTVKDFEQLFPDADDSNFTVTGGVRTGISTTGREYFKQGLTKSLLQGTGFKEIKKAGKIYAVVTVRVTAEGNAVSEVSRNFEAFY